VKIFFDHNMSPKLARALQELFRDRHEIVALRDKFDPSIKDIEWITDLSRDGNWIVISADRRITRNKAERDTFRNSRLVGFFLSAGLAKSPVTKQAERLLALWTTIEKTVSVVQVGAVFELPMSTRRVKQLK